MLQNIYCIRQQKTTTITGQKWKDVPKSWERVSQPLKSYFIKAIKNSIGISSAFLACLFSSVAINQRDKKQQQNWAITHKNQTILYKNSYYQNQEGVI